MVSDIFEQFSFEERENPLKNQYEYAKSIPSVCRCYSQQDWYTGEWDCDVNAEIPCEDCLCSASYDYGWNKFNHTLKKSIKNCGSRKVYYHPVTGKGYTMKQAFRLVKKEIERSKRK